MEESIKKADILIEALPYLQAFRGKVIVAKYGGSAIDNPAAMQGILQDLVFLSVVGIHPVLVHGGGPMITKRLAASGTRTKFVDGMRVTDASTIRIVKQELEGVNARLVAQVRQLHGRAEGVVSQDGVVVARPHPQAKTLGFVGVVESVRAEPLRRCFAHHTIPVVSPIGAQNGQLYNINADTVASHIAAHLKAEKLVLLTNVRGILRQAGEADSLMSTLSMKDAKLLIERGVIQEGMIPKVHACVEALRGGVKKAHIIDAAIPRAMLLEIFTKRGIGTELVK